MMGQLDYGISIDAVKRVSVSLVELLKNGHEVAVVVGGGNIFRGLSQGASLKMARTPADQMGMLATFFNGIALREAIREQGSDALLMSAIDCPLVAEKYQWERALATLHDGKIVIFVAGTGHPYFTTDSAAALRASEIKANILLKATTKVDGVYTGDPLKDPKATKFDRLSYSAFVEKKLGVMDLTAITLCMTNGVPIRVFNFYKDSLLKAASGADVGTLIN